MRHEISMTPRFRIRRKFLLLPYILENSKTKKWERRWLEFAIVKEKFDVFLNCWLSESWEDD